LAVNGRDLIEAGIPPGAAVGEVLRALLEAVIEGRAPNERAALLTQAAGMVYNNP
jgi:tRNA nucleotidyltransferase (CCA-adding enzyme)